MNIDSISCNSQNLTSAISQSHSKINTVEDLLKCVDNEVSFACNLLEELQSNCSISETCSDSSPRSSTSSNRTLHSYPPPTSDKKFETGQYIFEKHKPPSVDTWIKSSSHRVNITPLTEESFFSNILQDKPIDFISNYLPLLKKNSVQKFVFLDPNIETSHLNRPTPNNPMYKKNDNNKFNIHGENNFNNFASFFSESYLQGELIALFGSRRNQCHDKKSNLEQSNFRKRTRKPKELIELEEL
ncbi:hypothetical protein HK099_000202 [Clydaea vesicula]|uniref:Uncharacterized protein n=1 Tax=Clydaea vesicula TaxID=447962 RepID=A0AAD5TWZ5_9FUNG|nr:hypothetical protein HK099_000202 [Clydaea vesicula]KAJ3381046.1 hypothetical protein HDU92_005605 [Lobulomyces angularis]